MGNKRWSSVFRNVTFLKNTTSFSFSPFLYFRASNLGKIDGNFSWEIVKSSAVLDHWDGGRTAVRFKAIFH